MTSKWREYPIFHTRDSLRFKRVCMAEDRELTLVGVKMASALMTNKLLRNIGVAHINLLEQLL